jgi:hypothetical protein
VGGTDRGQAKVDSGGLRVFGEVGHETGHGVRASGQAPCSSHQAVNCAQPVR